MKERTESELRTAVPYARQRLRATLRHELLDRTIVWNQQKLEHLLREYVDHYNTLRPHRGIVQRALNDLGDVVPLRANQSIHRTSTCAGLVNQYRPAA